MIFPAQLAFGVWFLKTFGKRKYAADLKEKLDCCKEGTIGRELLSFMTKNGFDFVPHYEKHDMKHVILGYKPKPDDELRMQAFMFGNAGFSFTSVTMAAMFIIWTPGMWKDFKTHFQKGKKVKPIGHFTIEDLMDKNLIQFRKEIGL